MGQRYQAFVIARVRPHSTDSSAPPRYRCIAAFHHQWCYGRLPLIATNRFITQVKQANNAEIIRTEIAAIQGKYGRWKQEPQLPRIPCPFTAFLLATNWSVDLEDPDVIYASGVSFDNGTLHADMGSRDGDNNDGISVIDVTDPANPLCCFVFHGGKVPLSAEQYVRRYYPEYTPPAKPVSEETEDEAKERLRNIALEEHVQAVIAGLKDVKLVDVGMLAEAWPREYGKKNEREVANVESVPDATTALLSLTDMTIAPAIVHAIEIEDTADIEAMMEMLEKASSVKKTLRELSPFPDAGMALLTKVFEKELKTKREQLDLSGFNLSSAQLKTLFSSLEPIDVVNLSHTPATTIDDVRVILTAFPRLKRLILIDCPSISSADIRDLLDAEPQLFTHLEALIHPFLLGILQDTSNSCPYRNAFSYIGLHNRALRACSLPFFTPSAVIQALIDTLRPLRDQFASFSVLQTSMVVQAAFSSVRARGQKWSERETVTIPQLSLRAFGGEGWTFAFNIYPYSENGNSYAFLRFKTTTSTAIDKEQPAEPAPQEGDTGGFGMPGLTWEIHDLASFIDQVTLDGMTSPPDEAVSELRDILTTLQTVQNVVLMSDKDVKEFVTNAMMSVHLLY